ncbi:MAG: hypothetical protein EPO28_14135 [Saprospiraceae bacterium]|nr:MAG: hypothetical protein EPO28_14135 [Saprospiraceae bacterium]
MDIMPLETSFIKKSLRTYFLRNLAEPAREVYFVYVTHPSQWEDTLRKITNRNYQFEIALELPEGSSDFPSYLRNYVATAEIEEPFLRAWLELPDLSEAQARRWLADYQAWEERRVQAIFQNGQTAVQGTLF